MRKTILLYERFLQMLDDTVLDLEVQYGYGFSLFDNYSSTVVGEMNSVLKGVKVKAKGYKKCKIKRIIWMGWKLQLVIQFNKTESGVCLYDEIDFE